MTRLERRTFLLGAASAAAIGPARAAPERARPWASAPAFADGVGVNIHISQKGSVYDRFFDNSILPALHDLGVSRIREAALALPLGAADPHYARIRRLARDGFRFSAVCYDPTNAYVLTPPERVPEIFRWFEGAIDTIEGGNEPDLAADPARNPALSAAHQRALSAIVRATPAMRAVQVASPSYIQGNVALAESLGGSVDLSNLHPYPGMEHPETAGPGRLAGFMEGLRRVNGTAPPLVTETGYHTAVSTASFHLPVSEEIRARYIPRLLLWSHLAGVRQTYLYELRSSFDRGPADAESHFGLLTHDGRETAAYRAVKALLALFRSRGPSKPRTRSDPVFGFAGNARDLVTAPFRRADGSPMLAVWLGVPGWNPASRTAQPPVVRNLILQIDGPNRGLTAHRFGDDGRVTKQTIALADGRAEIPVSDQLHVLEL